MSRPMVSVIIPVYNTGESAVKLIRFLLKGKYRELDIIAVDDGSTDGSLGKLKEIDDARVRVFHQKNGGASAARNLGIEKVRGEFIAFIDSDDSVAPEYLTKLVNAADQDGVALATSAYLYHRVREDKEFGLYTNRVEPQRENETYKAYVLRLMAGDGRLYAVINKLFRAEVIKKHKLRFDTSKNFAEDTKFVLDYLAVCEGELVFVREPLYIYNYGTATSTVVESSLLWENWQKSYDDLVRWVGAKPTRRERKWLRRVRWRWAVSHKLAVARANKPWREKRRYAKAVPLALATVAVRMRK